MVYGEKELFENGLRWGWGRDCLPGTAEEAEAMGCWEEGSDKEDNWPQANQTVV